MSREIKFRAYIPVIGIMLYDVVANDHGKMIGFFADDLDNELDAIQYSRNYGEILDADSEVKMNVLEDESGEWLWIEEGEFILMQYGGFKDKNGSEAYDGDIYRNGENGLIGFMSYHESLGGDILWAEEKKDGQIYTLRPSYELDMTDFEIAGNIHQNHELLKA